MTAPKLQRWELEDTGEEFCELEFVKNDNGHWVKYADLATILAIVEAAVRAETILCRCESCVAVRAAREKGVIG